MLSHRRDAEDEEYAVTLHEDRVYYPEASEVYGHDVETLVQEEDALPLSVPIVAPAVAPGLAKKQRAAAALSLPYDANEPLSSFDPAFLAALSRNPERIRNVAVVGHIHHGKTALLDVLVEATHPGLRWELPSAKRYLDTHELERARKISLRCHTASLVLEALKSRASFVFNILDTPGHVDFVDEAACALRLCDGAVLVVDAVEGVMANTARLLRRLVLDQIPFVVALTKIDRLILELKLPPNDTYLKLKCVIEEINSLVVSLIPDAKEHDKWRISPERNNVCFVSSEFGIAFSLRSFARRYAQSSKKHFDEESFAARLWGNLYYHSDTRKFSLSAPKAHRKRTFEQFILEPLYKIFTTVLGEPKEHVAKVFSQQLGIRFRNQELDLDAGPLLKLALSQFLGPMPYAGLVDVIAETIPSPRHNAKNWVSRHYLGSLSNKIVQKYMLQCRYENDTEVCGEIKSTISSAQQEDKNDEDDGSDEEVEDDYEDDEENDEEEEEERQEKISEECPLVVHVAKMFPTGDQGNSFLALGRVVSGTLVPGMTVRVLSESKSLDTADDDDDEEEESMRAEIETIAFGLTRYNIDVPEVTAGNLCLIGGVSHGIVKSGTLIGNLVTSASRNRSFLRSYKNLSIFAPLRHLTESVVKVAIEPAHPSDLPKMLDALRKVNKAYPLLRTHVEESGEHVVFGSGELYMDCVLHDLRTAFSQVDIKVSDPSTRFAETVCESSSFKCVAKSSNAQNRLTMICDPLSDSVVKDLETGLLSLQTNESTELAASRLQAAHGWDILSARSIWAFGPHAEGVDNAALNTGSQGTNMILDETAVARGISEAGLIPQSSSTQLGTASVALLKTVKPSVLQGFQWAVREGPLCEEPVRGVRFRLLDAELATQPAMRGCGQIIPVSRRLAHATMLASAPRLMEPVYSVEVQTPSECIAAVSAVFARRRGHVIAEAPRPGSPLFTVKGMVPVIDSFGFETDLRTHTQGQAFCQALFDHYQVVPGTPLDRTLALRPLEPAPPTHLARDFMVKTRRRKGLSEDVSILKYFDDTMLPLIKSDPIMQSLL